MFVAAGVFSIYPKSENLNKLGLIKYMVKHSHAFFCVPFVYILFYVGVLSLIWTLNLKNYYHYVLLLYVGPPTHTHTMVLSLGHTASVHQLFFFYLAYKQTSQQMHRGEIVQTLGEVMEKPLCLDLHLTQPFISFN